ncbi:polysaccharide deacetylase family protein [Qipengyuania mesophila]|uniref:polysaccharide deacetylase family protein n=1 Tax=Qipengyuania mesophila TaxID=2867246 RepID=UPI0035123DD2
MTAVYLTIDTEYSAGLAVRLGTHAREEVFNRSILCRTTTGEVGIVHQMEVMDSHGLKGVFFVDPMPALIWGTGAIAAVVEPILERGHEVQLHLHPEWLEIAGDANPLGKRTGNNLHQFTEAEQVELLGLARDHLVAAGAPPPTAFRAGNYGADDATLRALRTVGIRYDSSHVPGIAASDCRISLSQADQSVVRHEGVIEVPVGSIPSVGGPRHAQITALSHWELEAALRYCVSEKVESFNLVSHSFELMSRDRTRPNRILGRRFAAFCRSLASIAGADSATFRSRPPQVGDETGAGAMRKNPVRSIARMAEQFVANRLYGAK